MKKVYLETFGCQMNVLDSELVENQLRTMGYRFTPEIQAADVVLYNTCSVRERSEQKVWSRLGTLKQRKAENPSLVIGVIGCMAERDGVGLMKRMPHVDLMCGPSELDQLPSLIDNVVKTGLHQHALAGNTSRRTKTLEAAEEDGLELLDLARSFSPSEQKFQAYIRIVRGCNKFCTYCVVPYTRGAEVSRSPAAILAEARKLVDAGCQEITLLGQTVNHYVHEEEGVSISTSTGPAKRRTTFADLLTLLHDKLPELPRLRFVTSFPADFGDDILYAMAALPRVCRYLHIPAQSGSNRLLKMMNRGYSIESYNDLLERARTIVQGIQLAGDIIVGFPSETDEDYAMTRTLLERARYKNCFIFKYSPRPGTTAIKRFEDDVPEEVKRFRNNDLLHLQNRISKDLNLELTGTDVDVLVEGPSGWVGRSGGGGAGDGESVVAGARVIHEHDHAGERACETLPPKVELGSTLARGVKASAQIGSVKAGTQKFEGAFRVPQIRNGPGWVQMTGRTSADQIVIFNGPEKLSGSICRVQVREAHGMTIFADWAGDATGSVEIRSLRPEQSPLVPIT